MRSLIIISGLSLLMQACVATPVKTNNQQSNNAGEFSVEDIKQREEAEYAQKLERLNKRNPVQDAQQSISQGEYYLLAYQSGRGGINKAPGLTQAQAKNSLCRFKRLDGLGDSIYGENHLKYRVKIRQYASQFNQTMYAFCH